jgi:hypothetical protein
MNKITWNHVLETGFLDLVYCNCMRIPMHAGGPNSVTSSSIEEYVKYEQHHLNLLSQVIVSS